MKMPSGFGSVVKLSGNRRKPYAVRVTVGWDGNKQIRKYVSYHETKREAITALAEFSQNPYDVDAKKITFAEVWESWKKEHFDKGSKSSQSAWKVGFDHCKPVHDMRLMDIKLAHLKPLLQGKGSSTQGQIRTVCVKIFQHAIINEWTEKDPTEHLKVEKTEPVKMKEVFSEDEIKDLWKNVKKDPLYELIIILLYTGMRIEELLQIKQENVFEDHMIGGLKSEAGKNRIIPLHKKIRKFIKKRLDGNEYLIHENGEKVTYRKIQHPFSKLIPGHTLHETRHTFISRMHTAGCDEITLQIIVGHALSTVTSKVYIHKEKDELIKAVHLID